MYNLVQSYPVKHLFKYLNAPSTLPTSSKTITRVKVSNVKTSKLGAL